MSRRIARENIFKLVFEFLFSGEENELSLNDASNGMNDQAKKFISDTYHAVISNHQHISALVEKHSHGFAFDRIYKIDLAILFVAISEILYSGTPYLVSISEAVDLAKKYSTDKSPAFINGVLAGIVADCGIDKIQPFIDK